MGCMSAFWKAFGLGLLLYFVAGRIPLVGGILGWVALGLAGFFLARFAVDRLSGMRSPAGYGFGMGALVWAVVAVVGVLLNLALDLVVLTNAHATTAAGAAAGLGAGLNGLGSVIHLFFAPFVGGFFGGFGGLIGASGIRKE